MKKYEVMFIVDIANEEVIQAAVKLVQDTIVRIGGTVTKVDEWGKRHLAYEVKHQNEGYYVVIDFKIYKNSTQPYLIVRNISSGEELKTRIKRGNIYKSKPFGEFSILKIYGFIWDFKRKKVGDDWIITDEKEPILEEYEVIKNEE